jgi:hypothetical protein
MDDNQLIFIIGAWRRKARMLLAGNIEDQRAAAEIYDCAAELDAALEKEEARRKHNARTAQESADQLR